MQDKTYAIFMINETTSQEKPVRDQISTTRFENAIIFCLGAPFIALAIFTFYKIGHMAFQPRACLSSSRIVEIVNIRTEGRMSKATIRLENGQSWEVGSGTFSKGDEYCLKFESKM